MREPNSDFVITNEEWQLLKGMRLEVREVYYAIRKVACFHHGFSGEKYQLTMQSLINRLTINAYSNQKKFTPTQKYIRNCLATLKEIKLIEEVILPGQKAGTYLFYLNHAKLDNKSPNKYNCCENSRIRTESKQSPSRAQVIHMANKEAEPESENYNKLINNEKFDIKIIAESELSTTENDGHGSSRVRAESEQSPAFILDTELQNSDIQNSPSPASHPPMALTPPIAPSASRKKEKENFDLEDEQQKAFEFAYRFKRDLRWFLGHLIFIATLVAPLRRYVPYSC